MEESILKSTKKILNVAEDDESFDLDIITHINAAFSHLQQLGVGPVIGFQIVGESEEWANFFGEDPAPVYILNAVKINIALRVRSLFDPPQLPHVLAATERQLQESDWRLNALREATEWADPDPPVVARTLDLDYNIGTLPDDVL